MVLVDLSVYQRTVGSAWNWATVTQHDIFLTCYSRVPSPALVKGVYLDAVVCVLLQDLLCVFICVEGVHEDQGHIRVVSLVQVLWDKHDLNK